MFQLFVAGGPLMIPLLAISLIVVMMTWANIWRLATHTLPAGRAGDLRLRVLPFWGAVAVLIGVLGQVSGHYKMLGVLATAKAVNPKLVVMGLRECLVSTITGLVVCIFALLCWGGLAMWQRISESRASGSGAIGNDLSAGMDTKQRRMDPVLNRRSLAWGVPGVVLQTLGSFVAKLAAGSQISQIAVVVSVIGSICLLLGLAFYAQAKGRSRWWCLLGFAGFLGWLLLAVIPAQESARDGQSPPTDQDGSIKQV